MSNDTANGVPPMGAYGNWTYPPLVPQYYNPQWVATSTGPTDNAFNIPTKPGSRFVTKLAPEGVESSDGRILSDNSVWTRTPPLPLMFTKTTSSGHGGAVFVGNIYRVWREGGWIMGEGEFDTSADAVEAERLVTEGKMNRVSIDTAIKYGDFEEKCNEDFTSCQFIINRAELLGATIVPMAAFGDTSITIVEVEEGAPALVASALPAQFNGGDVDGYFSLSEPDTLQPITIEEDGKISGHLAAWKNCHKGFTDECVIAPHSKSDYAQFLIGKMGEHRVGVITMDTVHASENFGQTNAVRHYADTGTVAAYVTIKDGELGPYLTGFVEPDLDESHLRRLQACGISGDWRWDDDAQNMELVAILAVPTPGFSVPRFEEKKDVLVASLFNAGGEECIGCEESKKAADELAAVIEEAPNDVIEEVVEEAEAIEEETVEAEAELVESITNLLEDISAEVEAKTIEELLKV